MTSKTFYKSKAWLDLTNQLKLERMNEQGLIVCEYCKKPILKPYDCIAHHKIELTEDNVNDAKIALNPDNIMLVHQRCHNIIHERWGHEKPKEVYLVYGSPYSGKTTWVNDVASADDIIVDLDRIWECISIADRFHKSDRLKANVFGVRDTLLEQIKLRTGKWKCAYVIGGYPLKMDRERIANTLGAKLVFIDTSKEECLRRCNHEEWKEFIDEWFETYQP